jgi:hypothetical protein
MGVWECLKNSKNLRPCTEVLLQVSVCVISACMCLVKANHLGQCGREEPNGEYKEMGIIH